MDHPTSSFRWLAQQFNVNKDRIHRRWTGLDESKSTRDPANLKMDKYQDKALCWYLTQLWEGVDTDTPGKPFLATPPTPPSTGTSPVTAGHQDVREVM